MKNYCRIKIVGSNLKSLGMDGYKDILTTTNSFILDLTKQINSQKSASITEHPTFVEGRKRIEQIVPEPESLTIEGSLSEYRTNNDRGSTNVSLFREMLEFMNENAILVDVETETKSYYNFVLQSINVGQPGSGTISVSLNLREVWLFSAATLKAKEIDQVGPGGDIENNINNQVKEQSLKKVIEDAYLQMVARYGSEKTTAEDVIDSMVKSAINVGKSYGESGEIMLPRIKVSSLARESKKLTDDFVGEFVDSGLVKRTSDTFWDWFFGNLVYDRYPYLKDNVQSIKQNIELSDGYTATIDIPSRVLHKGEHENIYNQFAYYKPNTSKMTASGKLQYDSQCMYIYIKKPGVDGTGLTAYRRFTWDPYKFLLTDTDTTFKGVPDAVFKVENDKVNVDLPMGALHRLYGMAYVTYEYEVYSDSKRIVAEPDGSNYIIVRFVYLSSRMVKLILQVLKKHNPTFTFTPELLDILNMDGE